MSSPPRPLSGLLPRLCAWIVALLVGPASLFVIGEVTARSTADFRVEGGRIRYVGGRIPATIHEHCSFLHEGVLAWQCTPGRKPPRAVKRGPRVIGLGDSIMAPSGPGSFMARLERPPGAEVVNLAEPGFDTRQELAILRKDGLALAPDLVLLSMNVNDYERLVLHEGRLYVAPLVEHLERRRQQGALTRWLDRSYLRTMLALRELARDAPALRHERILEPLREIHRLAGRRLAVVLFPTGPRWTARHSMPEPIRHALADLRIPTLDLLAVFRARRVADVSYDGVHLTDEGHRLAAAAIAAFVRARGLLPR